MIPIILGYTMDLIFGDPRWMPHPVKIIGTVITKLEFVIRKFILNKRFAGIILAIIIIGLSWLIPFLLIKFAASIHKYAGWGISAVLIYTTLSIKDLKVHAISIYSALKNKNLVKAKEKISMMVGRDTENLSETEIIRATVETIAENTVDGIISPLFFAFLGGAPMAIAYKAVNTLDSMVGYKNKKYIDFGWASAKIDDLANFIPARISALIIPISSWLLRERGIKSWRIALRDGKKNSSPNSGIPQSATAGALGIQLGGKCSYHGLTINKPLIGDKINLLTPEHIKKSIKISHMCGILTILTGLITTYHLRGGKW
ncbi:MAG: adenosylcobinamide-phosphate synthase CbiB [Candidatus Omnitrophota bacterium]|nr:adenosylcobinamide-phosphate synthase CbiB [Candidatus Omnitrophota bacterium]